MSVLKEFGKIQDSFLKKEWGPIAGQPDDDFDVHETASTGIDPATGHQLVPSPTTVHTHDGTGARTTIVGGIAEAGATIPVASANDSIAIGDGSSTSGASTTVIGSGALGNNAANAVVIGAGAAITATGGNNSIVIGGGPSTSKDGVIVIGSAVGSTGIGNIVIGANGKNFVASGTRTIYIATGPSNVTVSANNAIIICDDPSSSSTGDGCIVIGTNTARTNSATRGIAIGSGAQVAAGNTESIGFGVNSLTAFSQQIRLGREREIVDQAGGQRWAITAQTISYTVPAAGSSTDKQCVVTMDATGGARTVTLPPVIANEIGRVVIVKKIDASANAVTVTADATGTADLIDGAATAVLAAQWDVVWLVATALDKWSILQQGSP